MSKIQCKVSKRALTALPTRYKSSAPMRSSSSIIRKKKSSKPSAPSATVFSVWPHEPLVLSTWWIYLPVEIQFLCNVLMMVHMVTVRTTIGMTNSSPLLSFKVHVPYKTNGILDGQSRCNKQNPLTILMQ